VSFIKQSTYEPDGRYPQGCNIALYTAPDRRFCEMETMAAERTIQPGAVHSGEEIWQLVPAALPLERETELDLDFFER
jgi:hypothetical protein